jgi:hypothetical protein
MKNMTSLQIFKTAMQYRLERGREFRYANGLGILELDGKRCELKNRKKYRTFTARKLTGSDHHRVFMYTPDLSVSNQKETRQRRVPILSDAEFQWEYPDGQATYRRRLSERDTLSIYFYNQLSADTLILCVSLRMQRCA